MALIFSSPWFFSVLFFCLVAGQDFLSSFSFVVVIVSIYEISRNAGTSL